MKDLIDERDELAKRGSSIIKRWNVNYIPATPPEQEEYPEYQDGEQDFAENDSWD